MRKVKAVMLSVCFLVLFATTKSNATDYSWLIGGSVGYLSSSTNVSVFFYGKSGTTISFLGSSSVSGLKGYCGMASLGASSTLLAQGYTTAYTTTTLSSDNVYIVACVRAAGSGNMLVAVVDASKMSTSKTSSDTTAKAPENDPPQEVIDRLNEAIQQITK